MSYRTREREPGLVRSVDPARLGRRHDDRPRLQPHLPRRQDQGHRRLVREPRHEARASSTPGWRASPSWPRAPRSSSGLLTPLAAGAIVGTLTVAFITNHRKAGFFVFRRPTEGWEYLMNLIAACIAIGCVGPGRWSLDNAIELPACTVGGGLITVVVDRLRRRGRAAGGVLASAAPAAAELAESRSGRLVRMIDLEHVAQGLPGPGGAGRRRPELRGARGRDRGAHRAVGLRQVHDAAHDQPAHRADVGPDHRGRQGHRRAEAARAAARRSAT